MDYFGINSADELPRLKEVYAEPVVEPTVISALPQEMGPDQEKQASLGAEASFFSVTERGELIEGAKEAGGSIDTSSDENNPPA